MSVIRHDEMHRRVRIDKAIAIATGLMASSIASADDNQKSVPTTSVSQIELLSRALELPPSTCSFGEEEQPLAIELQMNDEAAKLASEIEIPVNVAPSPPQ